jgi:CRP/FNR family nitrogen fixation transcriptional regulator
MQTALASTGLPPASNAALLRGIPAARPAAEAPALGSTRCLAKDEAIFAEGDRAAYFYKVVSGAVRTSKLLSDGRRQIDAFHLRGTSSASNRDTSTASPPRPWAPPR